MLATLGTLLVAGVLHGGDLLDRIVAVVDDRPVFLSEVRALQQLQGVSLVEAREALIDEALMYAEARRYSPAHPTRVEEEEALATLRRPQALETLPVEDALLRRLAHRQGTILKYIQLRFAPLIHIEEAEAVATYEARWGDDPDAPPISEVRESIIATLTRARLDARIEEWVAQLRAVATLRYNAPEPGP